MATQASHKPEFYVDALRLTEADAAFPLIRAIAPEVMLDQWLDYVERRCREGGLMRLIGTDGALIGLFSWRLGERLRHGRVLALDDFVTFELSQSAPGREALLRAAEELGRSLGCTGLEIRLGGRGFIDVASPKTVGWAHLGLTLASVIFEKAI